MQPMEFKGKRVLVTGGSAGIGKELARCFAQAGADLVLVARGEERLRAVAVELSSAHGVMVDTITEDLSSDFGAQRLFDKVSNEVGEIFALANNAGFGRFGAFLKVNADTDVKMIRLNVEAPVLLARFFLPQMAERGDGGILFTSSTAAFYPGPKMAVYHASKSFIQSFAEGIYHEMRPLGVTISILSPGFVNTELLQGTKSITETPMKALIMQPDAVAKAGFEAFRKRELCVVPGIQYKAMELASHILPRRLTGFLAKKVMAPDLK